MELRVVPALVGGDLDGLSDPERIDELTALERVKSAVCARQARVTDAFAQSQRARLVAAEVEAGGGEPVGVRAGRVGAAGQPDQGQPACRLARTLVREMPGVLGVLQRGESSEWRATVIARETAPVGAPIRHADHALAVAKGGETDLRNGNGRCARCNLTKDLRGWATQVHWTGEIVTTTPTGRCSHSAAHPPPKPTTPTAPVEALDTRHRSRHPLARHRD